MAEPFSYWRSYDKAARSYHHGRATVGRAQLIRGDDQQPVQLWQIEGFPDELRNGAQRLQEMGLSTMPLKGAKAIVLYHGGQRGQGVIVGVEDPRYRPQGLKGGEAQLYVVDGAGSDGKGGTVRPILQGLLGWVAKLFGKTITIGDADTVTLSLKGNTININGNAGDVVVNGISLVHHTHPDPQGGNTGAPNA